MLTTENTARELIAAIYTVIMSVGYRFMLILLLKLPVIFPQTTVCTVRAQLLPLVGISVQVTLVWLVVVGQLPQFDARMLYWIAGQSGATGLQVKISSLDEWSLLKLILMRGESGPAYNVW